MRRPLRRLAAAALALAFACAAPPPERPPEPEPSLPAPAPEGAEVLTAGEYLRRGRESVEAAQAVQGGNPWAMDVARAQVFAAHYRRARADFDALLEHHPRSPLAAEAQFLIGLINDHPHLNDFEAAAEAYRLTILRYPGTEAARKAAERLRLIETNVETIGNGPH